MDLVRKRLKLQVLVNYSQLLDSSTEKEFIATRKLLRRGDIISEPFLTFSESSAIVAEIFLLQPLPAIPTVHNQPNSH